MIFYPCSLSLWAPCRPRRLDPSAQQVPHAVQLCKGDLLLTCFSFHALSSARAFWYSRVRLYSTSLYPFTICSFFSSRNRARVQKNCYFLDYPAVAARPAHVMWCDVVWRDMTRGASLSFGIEPQLSSCMYGMCVWEKECECAFLCARVCVFLSQLASLYSRNFTPLPSTSHPGETPLHTDHKLRQWGQEGEKEEGKKKKKKDQPATHFHLPFSSPISTYSIITRGRKQSVSWVCFQRREGRVRERERLFFRTQSNLVQP